MGKYTVTLSDIWLADQMLRSEENPKFIIVTNNFDVCVTLFIVSWRIVVDKYIKHYISGIRRELPTQWC